MRVTDIMRMKARVILDQQLVFGSNDRYNVFLKVYEVERSKKFPDGIKAKFVMVDTEDNTTRLLIDNHEPYGFHVHAKSNKGDTRIRLDATDYLAALQVFRAEVERIVGNEK